MKHYSILLSTLLMGLLIAGCGSNDNPVVTPNTTPQAALTSAASVPADAVIDSARFYVHVSETDTQTVWVHEVGQTWNEPEVTYSSFGAAHTLTPFATVLVENPGWYPVDVTAQVQGWFDSTLVNYGFFLQPADTDTGKTLVDSREAESNHPFLEVYYTTWEGSHCDTLQAVADAYLFSGSPDMNAGDSVSLMIGRETGPDSVYQALVQFEFPVEIRYSMVGDRVWNDENMNGLQDDGEEGLANIDVRLYTCDGVLVDTTMTDESGVYLFEQLEPGEYYLEFVNPVGWVFTSQNEGDDDAVDSDVDRYQKRTACFMLKPGEEITSWDAGLFAFNGCTYSKGYWKNHAGFGPQADELSKLLPIWLGNDDGGKSMAVTDAQIAVDVLSQDVYGRPRNGITKLYAQLLAAKLNIVNFANPEDVLEVINNADSFLADHDWMDWEALGKEDQQIVLGWKDILDQYNNGMIGPGHCDDDDSDDDIDMF